MIAYLRRLLAIASLSIVVPVAPLDAPCETLTLHVKGLEGEHCYDPQGTGPLAVSIRLVPAEPHGPSVDREVSVSRARMNAATFRFVVPWGGYVPYVVVADPQHRATTRSSDPYAFPCSSVSQSLLVVRPQHDADASVNVSAAIGDAWPATALAGHLARGAQARVYFSRFGARCGDALDLSALVKADLSTDDNGYEASVDPSGDAVVLTVRFAGEAEGRTVLLPFGGKSQFGGPWRFLPLDIVPATFAGLPYNGIGPTTTALCFGSSAASP